jgi:hypothetical protein
MLVRGSSRRFDDLAAAVAILLPEQPRCCVASAGETEQCVYATISAPLREILIDRALQAAPPTTLRNFTQEAANNSNPDQVIFSRAP